MHILLIFILSTMGIRAISFIFLFFTIAIVIAEDVTEENSVSCFFSWNWFCHFYRINNVKLIGKTLKLLFPFHSVEKYDKTRSRSNIFREINSSLVTSLGKKLIWRKKCWFSRKNGAILWKLQNFSLNKEIFRQINYLLTNLEKLLL